MGDALLKETARRLSNCIRETDTLARLSGDEFTIILGDIENLADIERVANTILQKLSLPFHLNEETVFISASIGITFYPDDAADTRLC